VARGCTCRHKVPSKPSTFFSKSQVKLVDIHFLNQSVSIIATLSSAAVFVYLIIMTLYIIYQTNIVIIYLP
jgi:hypothetical protein